MTSRRPWKVRLRRLPLLVAGVLVASLAAPLSAVATPTRYEAEDASCQGAVESNHTGFSGSGFCNTVNETGAFLDWTVQVPTAGAASLAFRFANGTTENRPMDISVNGAPAVRGLAFGPTGAWTAWETDTATASLPAGSVTIRATATTAAGAPNLDYLEVELAAPGAHYQAEDATISQGAVESNHAGFTGTGFVNFENLAGSYVEWTVNAAEAGEAGFAFRFANGTTTNRPMDIAVNGTLVSDDLAFPGTGAWSAWEESTFTAALNAGDNTIRATSTTANGGPNIDRLTASLPDTEIPAKPGSPGCDDIGEDRLTLSWGASSDNVGVAAYDIYHDGNKLIEAAGDVTSKEITDLTPNTEYRLSVFARDAAGNVSDSSDQAVCTTLSHDTEPPSAPSGLVHSNVTRNAVDLSWTGSTDNRGVTAYLVRNSANAVVHRVEGAPPATSTTVPNLECNTSHTLHVVAADAAGNLSGGSDTRTFTTGACARGTPQPPATASTGWTIPWDVSWAPDGSFALVTERDHFRVWRINANGAGKTQVGTVPNSQTTGGEGGLMGVAFSPTWNGTTDQDVFFMHTSTDNNRVVKMSFNGSSLSGYTVILNGIRKNRFHNGGRIRFGPDGFLYVATGDAQQSSLAQDRDSLNGKILRITKTGAAAPGNPFGTRLYSYGHRNPQGLAWDSAGRLWESELGASSADELNLILPGRNYGWPTCEGTCGTPGMENPKKTFTVSTASPSGIDIVNDTVYMAALRGERLWRIELNGTSAGNTSTYFVGTYGRLRAVSKVPGADAIWFGTTNADNNGGEPDGSDRILRSEIR